MAAICCSSTTYPPESPEVDSASLSFQQMPAWPRASAWPSAPSWALSSSSRSKDMVRSISPVVSFSTQSARNALKAVWVSTM
eukprot:1191730-Prorocentrum_minimum.AAC.1